jgi:hypothetical protein
MTGACPTLIAFIRTLEATAQDDVLDLFDVVITRIFVDAQHAGREAPMRGLRDLDAAAQTPSQGWRLLLRPGEGDPRGAVFTPMPREMIEAAMARVDALVRPRATPISTSCCSNTAASDASYRAWRGRPGSEPRRSPNPFGPPCTTCTRQTAAEIRRPSSCRRAGARA